MKVLIVEDERLERRAMEQFFRMFYSNRFSTVTTASNGQSALRLLESTEYELVMLDINLPDISGLDILKTLDNSDFTGSVIMVTAYSDYEYLRDSLRYHCFDYLLKPYSIDSFKESIDRYLKSIDDQVQYGQAGIVQKIKKLIEENYQSDITLMQIATSLCLDQSYIGRVFKKEEGKSIMGYLLEFRLEKAKYFLSHGMSVADCAFKVGFHDPAYFGKCFKREIGKSPSEYR